MKLIVKEIVNSLKSDAVMLNRIALNSIILYKDDIYNIVKDDININVQNFIDKYDDLIHNMCFKRYKMLRDEVEDCKQYVKMHLCRMFREKCKYIEFDKVVSAVIKRKIIDYTKKHYITTIVYVNESDFTKNEENKSYIDNVSIKEKYETNLIEILYKVLEIIKEDKNFTKVDIETLKLIIEKIENGILDIKQISKSLEDDVLRSQQRFKILTIKLNKYCKELIDEIF